MARPSIRRVVDFVPEHSIFKPVGLKLEALPEIRLNIEELEALRLADLQGMPQLSAAASMHVSRSTFQRLLQRARGKVARALVEGTALKIGGGNYRHRRHRCHCPACGHDWYPLNGSGSINADHCPICGERPVMPERRRHHGK